MNNNVRLWTCFIIHRSSQIKFTSVRAAYVVKVCIHICMCVRLSVCSRVCVCIHIYERCGFVCVRAFVPLQMLKIRTHIRNVKFVVNNKLFKIYFTSIFILADCTFHGQLNRCRYFYCRMQLINLKHKKHNIIYRCFLLGYHRIIY